MKSAVLESKLQHDLLDGAEISNPAHVRMLCYVMKLMEKKGQEYEVLFAGMESEEAKGPAETWTRIRKSISEHTDPHDVNIAYTEWTNVIALYDRTESQVDEYISMLRSISDRISITRL